MDNEPKVTNYIVSSTNCSWTERYVLPDFRGRMNEILDIAEERGYEPLLVIGKDGRWWNDELDFVLDRMSDGHCCKGDLLYAWSKEVEQHPLKLREIREIAYKGNTYTLTANTDDLSHDGQLTDDCEVIEEEC